MIRLARLVAFSALGFAAVMPLAAVSPTSVEKIEESIRANGARKTLETFFDCDASGMPNYSQVAKGEKRWIDVAVRLMPDAEGCFAEFLSDAIARALPANPTVVLRLIGSDPRFSPQRICVPFLSEDDPIKKHRAYLAKLETALASVKNEKLQRAKKECLTEVTRHRGYLK